MPANNTEHLNNSLPESAILTRDDGATIAYSKSPGTGSGSSSNSNPGVMFLTGFKSDMQGSKALAVEKFCQDRGQSVLRFDYTGHGQSSGDFDDGCIGQWTDDAVYALDNLTEGPQVLVGSSMGGWIMLLVALRRPERVAGLLGLAAAPDFTEDLIWDAFSDEQKSSLEQNGFVELPNCYDEKVPYRISARLVTEGRNHLLLGKQIDIDVPVRLIHGIKDDDVPWSTSVRLSEMLRSEDVETTFVKTGDHRLSEPADLDRLTNTLGKLLDQLESRNEG